MRVPAALVAAAVVTAGQLPPAGQDPNPAWVRSAVGEAVVVGRIVDQAGESVRRALVRLEGPGVALTRVADDQGRFFFRYLPEGAYTIDASRYGYLDGSFGRTRPGGDRLELPLADGEWRIGITVTLFEPAVISGAVDDEANAPVVGVMVQALRREFIAGRPRFVPAGSATTDDRGLYRIHGLAAGDYVVSVPSPQVTVPVTALEAVATTGSVTGELSTLMSMHGSISTVSFGMDLFGAFVFDTDERYLVVAGRAPRPPLGTAGRAWVYATTFYPGADLPALALPVTIAAGEERAGIAIQVRPVPAARVSGVVVGPDGLVPGQMLRLIRDDAVDLGLGSETAATLSAPDGSFRFLNVPAGHYTIEARSARSTLLSSPVEQLATVDERVAAWSTPIAPFTPEQARWGRATLAVYGDDVEAVVVEMEPGMTVAGRVAFEGASPAPSAEDLARIRIAIERPTGQGSGVPPGQVDGAGRFVMRGIVPGQYFVRVGTSPPGWTFVGAVTGGRDVSDVPMDAIAGLAVDDLVLRFTDRPTEVTGTARAPSGVPIPGARVVVFPAARRPPVDYGLTPRRLRDVQASIHGVYRIAGLPPGNYLIAALDDRDAGTWRDPATLERLAAQAVAMTVRDGDRQVRDVTLVEIGVGRD